MKKPISLTLMGLYITITGIMQIVLLWNGGDLSSLMAQYYGLLLLIQIVVGVILLTGNLIGRILFFIKSILLDGVNIFF